MPLNLFLYAALFIPLFGFLLLMGWGKNFSCRFCGGVASLAVVSSFFLFSFVLISLEGEKIDHLSVVLFQWIKTPSLQVDFLLHVDHLSLLMALVITGVGFLIHVYSIGYMEEEEEVGRFFASMNFFIFSMLLLVLSGNMLLLFVGWEGVGLASYLLIGFWYQKPIAAAAATKAFIVNRVGDMGFLIALLLTFFLFETFDIALILDQAKEKFTQGAPVLTLLTFLYFFAATGKSAQIPLHTWLADAMAGPTPVSALIHAATMVTAGVYLVVRLSPLFLMTPFTLHLIGILGGATALFAALCALGQSDLKRVLAYSTVSQLGLMFLACGAGSFYAAMFHLTSHAFVKALLFLSAGNVVHLLQGETNMEKMGGLSKKFPKTMWLFLLGVLALSGIPPFSAFFSKDLILEQELVAGFKTLFFVGLAASILTAVYLTRAFFLTFMGKPRCNRDFFNQAKEAPWVMLLPVCCLAVLSMGGGFLGFAFGRPPVLVKFLSDLGVSLTENEWSGTFLFSFETLIALLGAFFGIGVSLLCYTVFQKYLKRPFRYLQQAFFIDELYRLVFILPLKKLARGIAYFIEPQIIEGSIRGVKEGVKESGHWMQQMQSGLIRSFIGWIVIGSVFLIMYFIV